MTLWRHLCRCKPKELTPAGSPRNNDFALQSCSPYHTFLAIRPSPCHPLSSSITPSRPTETRGPKFSRFSPLLSFAHSSSQSLIILVPYSKSYTPSTSLDLVDCFRRIPMGTPEDARQAADDTSRLPSYRPSHLSRYHPYPRFASPRAMFGEDGEGTGRSSGVTVVAGLDVNSLPAFWRRKLAIALFNLSTVLRGRSNQAQRLDLNEVVVDLAFAMRAARRLQQAAQASSTDPHA
ncbi:hypothetical protein OBBRIDRAFT_319083 [Obba rivulosa]|uniref:Uncharacterized protein n=1 Tax=Obba rivulosa TaxID=1052685 RepID=A0A8E2DPM9_9APHY|nr:hypothetical protein OBBRIDRAFT_319083 [Obba rivulosa]